MIVPKAFLNTPEFDSSRRLLSKMRVDCIQDFGENGFKGVLVETICLFVNTEEKPHRTAVESLTLGSKITQRQSYITDENYPYWLIYRDSFFDEVSEKLEFGKFKVFRDRQITNSNTTQKRGDGQIRVLKSRNISDDGKRIIDIDGYDTYMDEDKARELAAYRYVGDRGVYLTPNMTYRPRVMRNTEKFIVNGSVAVLIPNEEICLSDEQLEYFSSDEYRRFYQIARNYQTRSLNVDSSSVFFYGILRERTADASEYEADGKRIE